MKHRTKLLISCSAAATLLSSPALAQGDSYGDAAQSDTDQAASSTVEGGEIVVTAGRRSQILKEVPQSIVALTDDALDMRGVDNFDALGRQTPGLVMNERADRTPNIVMRGVGSFGNVQGVGFYIDDVQNFTDQTMRMEDIGRVEILKGPQGTLYGGSSIGGAVRYITKVPEFDFNGEFAAEVGEQEFRNFYGAVNLPLSDVIATRISGSYSADNGFLNSPNFEDVGHWEEISVRGQFLAEPSDRARMLLTVRYRDFDGGFGLNNAQDSVSEVSYINDVDTQPNTHSKTIGVVGKLEYDLGGAKLESISSFTRQKKYYIVDVDYTSAPLLFAFADDPRPTKILTQELRLTSTSGGNLDWIAGLYAARLHNATINPSPMTLNYLGFEIPGFYDYKTKQTDLAAFGSVDFHLGDLTMTGGLRLYDVEYEATVYQVAGAPTLTKKDTVLLPRVSLAYQTAGGTNLYGSIAQGYEPGKVSVSTDEPFRFNPEKTWAFELGVKGYAFTPDFYYELAAFYTMYQARQFETRVFDETSGNIEIIDNIGDSTSYGVEGSFAWSLTDYLSINGALGYLNAEWDEGAVFDEVDISGLTPPNSPTWTGNIGATVTVPVSNDLELSLHADASYMDEFEWNLDYSPISNRNPSYWVAFAKVSLGDTSGLWKIAAQMNNVFDKKYYTQFTPQFFFDQGADGTCDGCHLGYTAERRRFVVSGSYKF